MNSNLNSLEPICPEPTCPEPTCQEPTCQEPTCLEPICPEPTCQEPTCQEPTCQEPTCLEPTCLEPTCLEPICPEPKCPEPSCPEPNCPVLSNYVLDLSTNPIAPNKILSITAMPGNTFIDLYWDAPFNGGRDINYYLIQKSMDLYNWDDISSSTTSFKIANLINNKKYYFKINAINIVGNGPTSDIIIATPVRFNFILYTKILAVFILLLILFFSIKSLFKNNNKNEEQSITSENE